MLLASCEITPGIDIDPHALANTLAVGGYTTTAVLSSLIGAATTVWQAGVLRAGSRPVMASASRSQCDGGARGPQSRTVR